jgi:hypothetical protein
MMARKLSFLSLLFVLMLALGLTSCQRQQAPSQPFGSGVAVEGDTMRIRYKLAVAPQGVTGSGVERIVSYTQTITPAATAAAIGTTAQTFTVTGLATTDRVIVNVPGVTSLCPMVHARVSAANTLQLWFSTLTAAACTPAAGSHTIIAIRF